MASSRIIQFNKISRIFENLSRIYGEQGLQELLEAAEALDGQGNCITRNNAYCLLQACENTKNLNSTRRVQFLITPTELCSIAVLGDHLIRLFSYHGHLVESTTAFSKITKPSPYTWSAIIGANSMLGHSDISLELYHRMHRLGIEGDNYVNVSITQACGMREDVMQGRYIHCQIVESGLQPDVVVGNALVDMYAKCGSLEEAYAVFKNLNHDVISWGTMISGYMQHGEPLLGLECFCKMQQEGLEPNKVTFLGVLKGCSHLGALKEGRLVHGNIIQSRLHLDQMLQSSLIDMYVKCGGLEEALLVFSALSNPDEVLWNVIIAGFVEGENPIISLDYFYKMQHEGMNPSKVTFLIILKACAKIGAIEQGRIIHTQIVQSGIEYDSIIGSALVDMYAKCRHLNEGHKAFNKLLSHDVVLWGILIAGYAEHEEACLAIECFERMQIEGVKQDYVICILVLNACARIGALGQARFIHGQIIDNGGEVDILLGNALVNVYAKCGNPEEAYNVFIKLPSRNVVTWNAMIAGYSQNGQGCLALNCFGKMQYEGINADVVSLTNVLVACSHAGLVDEGCWHFVCMQNYFYVLPTVSHCACMVDLLGHPGFIDEAEDFLHSFCLTNIMCFMSLLNACKLHGDIKLGQHCFNKIVGLGPSVMINF